MYSMRCSSIIVVGRFTYLPMGSMQTRPLRHFDASLGRSVVSGDVMDAFENTHTEPRQLIKHDTALGVGIFKRFLSSPGTNERPNKKQNGVFA